MNRLGVILTTFFGILIGVVNALVWVFGYINFVRPMIPYALFSIVFMFITTAVLKAACGNARLLEGTFPSPTCRSVSTYSPVILITAAIFIVFAIVVLATHLAFVVRIVLAFIGCVSFWVMLLSFVAMIVFIFRKCSL